MGARQVFGEEHRVEAVAGVVGQVHDLVLGAEPVDDADRAEDLLAVGRGVQREPVDNRRAHHPGTVLNDAAGVDPAAERAGALDIGDDLLEVPAAGQRREAGCRVERVTDGERLGRRDEPG